jgi:dienelactone hydrolase
MWVSLAHKLARLCNVPALRLDYREPSSTRYCTEDIRAAVRFLNNRFGVTDIVLACWSFGSAPAFTAASQEDRIRGVVCVAPQNRGTAAVYALSPRPLLLLHGTGDQISSDRCSKQLFEAYGNEPGGDRVLRLFEGDDHGLTDHALEAEEAIFHFVAKVLEREIDGEEAGEAPGAELIGGRRERINLMKQGHDLEGESL